MTSHLAHQQSQGTSRSWIETDAYLREALDLTTGERQRLERAAEQLPYRIADAHTHVARAEDVDGLSDDVWSHVVSTFPSYSLDVAQRVRDVVWPQQRVWSLRMPHAVGGYRHRAINEHLLAAAAESGDVVGGYGVPDDVEYTTALLTSGVAALKMYYRYREPAARSLSEVFPEAVLAAAMDLGVPIIVHLPCSLPGGLTDLIGVARRFPLLRMVIAHAGGGGGQFYRRDLRAAFNALAALPTVFFDTALVWDRRLLESLLAAVGPDRVLFGSDEPLSLVRAVPYRHARLGPRLYARRYHWASEDHAPAWVRTARPELLHLLQVEAVLAAVRPYGADAVLAVFHDNAARLFLERVS